MKTSFNLRRKPIACTSTDAIRTFFSSGVDSVVITQGARKVNGRQKPRSDRFLDPRYSPLPLSGLLLPLLLRNAPPKTLCRRLYKVRRGVVTLYL